MLTQRIPLALKMKQFQEHKSPTHVLQKNTLTVKYCRKSMHNAAEFKSEIGRSDVGRALASHLKVLGSNPG